MVRLPTFVLTVAVAGTASSAFVPAISRAQASPSPSPASSAAAPASANTVAVDTSNFAYAPETIAVPAGSTVVFTNSDSTAHTVTATDGSFDSKNMDEHQTWSHVFTKTGTYAYVCAYHAFMHGTVIVK